jgi:DNA end-binding protein Ku
MVLRDKEHLVAVRPGDDVLILETMYFADEIRSPSEELETLPKEASFAGRELEVAKRLVDSLTVPWEPGDYQNTYRARVEELIDRKREGESVVFEEARPKSNVIDLMAALEASVAKMGPDADSGAGGAGACGTGAAGAGTSGTRASRARGGGATAARSPAQSGPPDLDALSKADLLARAAELDLPGRSKMSKPELIKAIQAASRPKRGTRKIS